MDKVETLAQQLLSLNAEDLCKVLKALSTETRADVLWYQNPKRMLISLAIKEQCEDTEPAIIPHC